MNGEGVALCYVEPNFYGCRHGSTPTHLAIPLDAASLARLRERVVAAMFEPGRELADVPDAVLAALGLAPS